MKKVLFNIPNLLYISQMVSPTGIIDELFVIINNLLNYFLCLYIETIVNISFQSLSGGSKRVF